MASSAVTGSIDLTAKVRYLKSYEFAENAGAAARVLLRDGSTSGPIIRDIRLVASDSKGEVFPRGDWLYFPNGLSVQVSTGTVRGSVEGI